MLFLKEYNINCTLFPLGFSVCFWLLLSCADTFVPQELLFSLDEVELSAFKPAIYFEASIETEDAQIWDAHRHTFIIRPLGKTPFYGVIQLYILSQPWDQSTLPPYGNIVEQYNLQLSENQTAEIQLQTPRVYDSPNLYSMLYVEGEGEVSGSIVMKPTIWAQADREEEWLYNVMSYRY